MTWPTSDPRVWAPDTSMLPGSEKAPPAAVGLLTNAVQGAHDTIDRLADGAAPAVQQLGESVSAAEDALHAKTDRLRDIRDEGVESVRTTVRGNPLVAVAALILLPAVGLVTWGWFAMAQVEEDLRAFSAFERVHFEIEPPATENTEGARWPIPG